jgi:hypothetical protein
MLVMWDRDRQSRRRLCLAYEDKLLCSTARIVQYPRPAAVDHALMVEIQEAEETEGRGGGSLPAADGVAVKQVVLHCRHPPGGLPLPPITHPNTYFTLQEGRAGGRGGLVARLEGVRRGRGEGAPPLSTNVDSELNPVMGIFAKLKQNAEK